MSKIYLVSEFIEDEGLRNLFTSTDITHMGCIIGEYYGCLKRYAEVLETGNRKSYEKFLPKFLVDRIFITKENSKRFQLRIENIIESYVNPKNNKKLELESKHIILVEELDIL